MTEKGKVLIVDDDNDLRSILREVLSGEGLVISEANDGVSGLQAFSDCQPHAVLLDLNMPRMNGLDTLTAMKQINPKVPVIMMTAFGDIPTAVEAMRLGAYDFSAKPPEFDRLIILLKRAVEYFLLEMRAETANNALAMSLESLLGKSSAIKKVINLINHAALSDLSVIIQGETGTGKTFVAEALHNLSKRAGKPFVRVDIGLIPDSLVESELFGFKRGAFTGAAGSKMGFFEAADGGTIFIDEVENMTSVAQSKLLTVIERKEIYPIGSTSPYGIDIRIIAATNCDIRESTVKKEFREDLFYRLGEFIITIPPLRERSEDIPFFAQKFLLEACGDMKKQIRGLSNDALDFLAGYSWPGNLRELKNVMKRAVLFSGSDLIGKSVLEPLIAASENASDGIFVCLKDEVRELEKEKIAEAMLKSGGIKTKAAELLKINYKTFCEKLKEYKI